MDDLSRFCCRRAACPLYGQRGQGNPTICARYGAQRQHRLFYRRACKYRFSEHKSTPLFNSRLPRDKLLATLQHLADGCGVRQTVKRRAPRPAPSCEEGRPTSRRTRQAWDRPHPRYKNLQRSTLVRTSSGPGSFPA